MTPGGRRGRRTGAMVRIARTRVSDLFALAERAAAGGEFALADRYVRLARRIGMRYNVRVPTAYRDLYCRGCSSFWLEGRSVRTRLRGHRRVRTCLRCGATRRLGFKETFPPGATAPWTSPSPVPRKDEALTGALEEAAETGSDEESEEE